MINCITKFRRPYVSTQNAPNIFEIRLHFTAMYDELHNEISQLHVSTQNALSIFFEIRLITSQSFPQFSWIDYLSSRKFPCEGSFTFWDFFAKKLVSLNWVILIISYLQIIHFHRFIYYYLSENKISLFDFSRYYSYLWTFCSSHLSPKSHYSNIDSDLLEMNL